MSISKFNKGNPFGYEFPEKAKYAKLSETAAFYGDQPIRFECLSINTKGKFGPQPVAWIEGGTAVNLPKHLLEAVQAMIADPEVVAAVKAGKAGFRCRKYETRDGNEGLSAEWVDL